MKNLVRHGVFALSLGLLAVGCADSTGLERVTFSARAAGFEHGAEPVQFTTDTGWTVTLTAARMAVGPVYLNTIEPLTADRRSPLRRGFEDLFLRTAYAHGADHLGSGQVIGEVTQQTDIDVLSPAPVDLAGGAGINDRARTAELWLYNRDALQGAAVRVAGTAVRDDITLAFHGALIVDASLATATTPLESARRIRGIPVDLTLAERGTLTVRVDPRLWFQGADFRELADGTADASGAYAFTLRDNVGRAFANNVRLARGVYGLRFDAPIAATAP